MHYATTSDQQITRICLFMIITNFKMFNNFVEIEIKMKMWNILQMIHTLKLLCIIIISIFMLMHKSKVNLRNSKFNAHLKHSQFTLQNYSPLFMFISCCAQQVLCKWFQLSNKVLSIQENVIFLTKKVTTYNICVR
jgi:hypothetical protein